MAAAYKGYTDVVQLLVSSGADISAKDHSGNTAVKMAEKNGYTRIVDLLKRSGAQKA
jgi:ankyrin repeat protein